LKADSIFVSGDGHAGPPDGPGHWICYDFKERTIVPTHYSLRSASRDYGGVGGSHLKSWLIETSMNESNWTVVDERRDNADLNDQNVTRAFAVSVSQQCRFIRLVMLGKNHAGWYGLRISSFEIFGSLIE
jgi:hypothetical protein